MMSRIQTIARYTFLELMKSKVWVNTLFLGFLMLLVVFVAYSFTYGTPERVALNFGLGLLSLSSVGISVFLGASLFRSEIDSRTLYMVLSRNTKRYEFIVGKILGFASVLMINLTLLAVLTLALFFILGGSFSAIIGWSIVSIYFESLIMLVIVSIASMMSGSVLTVTSSLFIYIISYGLPLAAQTSIVKSNSALEIIIKFSSYILPNFDAINFKEFAIYSKVLPIGVLISNYSYSIFYIAFLMGLLIFTFNRKSLD